jgi:hypothetical protein
MTQLVATGENVWILGGVIESTKISSDFFIKKTERISVLN